MVVVKAIAALADLEILAGIRSDSAAAVGVYAEGFGKFGKFFRGDEFVPEMKV